MNDMALLVAAGGAAALGVAYVASRPKVAPVTGTCPVCTSATATCPICQTPVCPTCDPPVVCPVCAAPVACPVCASCSSCCPVPVKPSWRGGVVSGTTITAWDHYCQGCGVGSNEIAEVARVSGGDGNPGTVAGLNGRSFFAAGEVVRFR